MSTNNHTAITTGAAANASTINSPLGELDAKMGNVSTLTTTATTLTGAANELDAGKLEGGVNLMWDPFNRYYGPPGSTTITQDGRLRWYAATGTHVNPDTDNPFGCPTVRITGSNYEGKRLYLSEAGLKIGDVISCGVYAKVATGRTTRLDVHWYTAADALISSVNSSNQVGDDGVHFISKEAITIPATASYARVTVTHISGSGNIDVYWWGAVRGPLLQTTVMVEGVSDGQRAEYQLQTVGASGETPLQTLNRLKVNLAQDPYGQLWPVSSMKQDGQYRWYSSGANCAINKNDTANPFGLPTLTISATTKGRKMTLSEMGLAAGDVVSLGILGKWAATSSWYVYIVWRNSGGTSLGTTQSTTAAGTAALQWSAVENNTIPATCTQFDFLLVRSTGSDNIDVYGFFVTKGVGISQAWAQEMSYAHKFGAGFVQKRDQLPADTANLSRLWSWRNAQARIYEAESNRTARIAVIGDSYTNVITRFFKQLAARLKADVGGGDAGCGFISAHSTMYTQMSGMPKYTSLTRTGSWTEHDTTTTPTGKGPDLCDAISTGAGDQYSIVVTATDFRIMYLKQTSGGTFKYRVDGGAWSSNVDTNATEAYAAVDITGLSSASHTIDVYANGATVTLLGFVAHDYGVSNGTVLYKLGNSGAATGNWTAKSSTTPWRDAITALAPDLVIIWLGANDAVSIADATYKANLDTLMDDIRVGLATVDFLLIAPPDHSTAHATEFESYSNRVRELAYEYPCGMIDMRQHIQYASTDPLDIFTDATHINNYGGAIAAGVIFRNLKW